MQIKNHNLNELEELEEQYASALRNYLVGGGETALERAYELGRKAIADRRGILDLAAVHQRALVMILPRTVESGESADILEKAAQFFAECIAPFEMTFRGFQESITALNNLNKTLERSEMKFRSVIQAANDAIISSDGDGNIISWNKRAETIFGYTEEEALGKPLTILMPERFRYIHSRKLERLRTTGESEYKGKTHESYGLKRDGGEFPIEMSIATWETEYGTFFTGIVRDITERKRAQEALHRAHDELEIRVKERTVELEKANEALQTEITERKQAEEALRESEERYRRLFEMMQENFSLMEVITDEQGRPVDYRFLEVNPALERYSGKSREQLVGRKHSDFMAAGGGTAEQKWFDIICRVGLTGKEESGEHYAISTGRWAQFYAFSPLHGQCAVISMDITDRKRAEEALHKAHDELELRIQERTVELKESNKLLQAEIAERIHAEEQIREQASLLDNAQEAIGVRNLGHRLIYWNKGAERLYGWTAGEVIGKNPVEFLFKGKEEPPQLIEAKRIVLEKGEWTGELHQITKDGKEIIIESRWTLVYDSEGKPKSILIINTDITEKKKLEVQLLRAQRMESIGTLAGGIAHDLNNVLTPTMLSLQMLKGKLKDEQSQKLLTILEQNSQRGADLIKQVLSFARGVEGERNPLAAKYIISEIDKIAKETFPRNIEIRTNISISERKLNNP